MITELVVEERTNYTPYILTWYPVAIKEYGSEGAEPILRHECPLSGDVSCMSGTGGSWCSHYMGYVSANVIRCSHER